MTQAAIADSATEVDAAALLVYRAAWTKDQGAARVTREAAMAKMYATEAAQHVIDRAVQLHGGRGVTSGEKVEELYREIRALRIYEGATEVQKIVIAREAAEEPPGEAGAGGGMMEQGMIPSAHVDTFARDNLPPQEQWPDFRFTLPELQYPERLNCVTEFARSLGRSGEGDRTAIMSPAETLTYAQLAERINRIANVLTRDLGMVPGNRVLMRAPNTPMAIAVYLAVIKAGGVMVATMPLLRAKELSYAVSKAKIKLALCDARLVRRDGKDEAARARARAHRLLGRRRARSA